MNESARRMSELLLTGKFMNASEVAHIEAERRRLSGEPELEPLTWAELNAEIGRLVAGISPPAALRQQR